MPILLSWVRKWNQRNLVFMITCLDKTKICLISSVPFTQHYSTKGMWSMQMPKGIFVIHSNLKDIL